MAGSYFSEIEFTEYKGKKLVDVQAREFLDYLAEKSICPKDWDMDYFYTFEANGTKNYERIVELYTEEEKKKYKEDIDATQPPIIKYGTRLCFPDAGITIEMQKILGSELFLKQKDFNAFWTAEQTRITESDGYMPFTDLATDSDARAAQKRNRNADGKNFQFNTTNVKIWIWVRALNRLCDVSAWVQSCSTNKTFDVGEFTIQVAPTDDLNVTRYANEFANTFHVLNKDNTINQDWFTKNIQNNDLVFIRFERLRMETYDDRNYTPNSRDFTIPPSDLNNDIVWDMMGLVDNVTQSIDAANHEYSIVINGRDYTKLIVEDGSYFIPLKFVEGSPDRWFYGGNPETAWFKRNMITGAYDYYFAYEFQQIKSVVWFIINQLSNIGIVEDSVFASCAKQNKKLPLETGDDKYKAQENEVKGIWKMIQVFVDDVLSDRRIVDRSLTNPEGTLLDLFDKVCQQPFVEFWGDTWGNGFDYIIRQPPFNKKAIQGVLNSSKYISVAAPSILSMSLSYDERAYAWYRLIPKNSMMGNGQWGSLAMVPIIFFEDFCKVFGNKRCIIEDIYLSQNALNGKGRSKGFSTLSEALLNDLLYVVESSVYLPFTRKGTITINGDRRIKVGTFIMLEPTMELFYVTGVTNTGMFANDAVDRTTTLTVERGMLRDYIGGANSKLMMKSTISGNQQYTYFDIANIEGMREEIANRHIPDKIEEGVAPKPLPPSKFGVNRDVFNFFLNRKMNDKS